MGNQRLYDQKILFAKIALIKRKKIRKHPHIFNMHEEVCLYTCLPLFCHF